MKLIADTQLNANELTELLPLPQSIIEEFQGEVLSTAVSVDDHSIFTLENVPTLDDKSFVMLVNGKYNKVLNRLNKLSEKAVNICK